MVFAKSEMERHAIIREYARGIIKLASVRSVLSDDFEIDRCFPPYNSPPIVEWPDVGEIKRLEDELGARAIVHSVVGFLGEDGRPSLAGDFGRYTMGGVGVYFSAEQRRGDLPRTPALDKTQFWRDVDELGSVPRDRASKSREAESALKEREVEQSWKYLLVSRNDDTASATVPSDLPELTTAFLSAEAALKECLTPELLVRYEAQYPYVRHQDTLVPKFNMQRAQCWVAARAVSLGWSKEKHDDIERNRSGRWDRRDHTIERIGKKYQWIAYWELVGYLADHHWYLDWNESPRVLDRIEDFDHFDLDPSFLLTSKKHLPHTSDLPDMALPPTDFQGSDVESDIAWTMTTDDLPEVTSIVEKEAPDGSLWWIAKAFRQDTHYMAKLQSDQPMRTAQFWLELLVVKEEDVKSLFNKIKDQDIAGPELVHHEEIPSRPIGEHTAVLIAETAEHWHLNWEFEGIKYARVAVDFRAHRGEYDQSGIVESHFAAPTPAVVRALKLRPDGPWSICFVTPTGSPAFFDSSFTRNEDGAVLVNANLLKPVLDEYGLSAVWIFIAEKDGGLGRGKGHTWNPQIDRRAFGGMWWQGPTGWCGDVWAAPKSWNRD